MGLAAFQRLRRLAAIQQGGVEKATAHAAGMNTRETISEQLKRDNVPHTLDDSKALARAAREAETLAVDAYYAKFADPEYQKQRDRATGRGPINTREIASRQEVAEGPLASVEITGRGKPAGARRDPPELTSKVAATHYAPPTSVDEGTDGKRPKPDDKEGTVNSAVGEGKASTLPPSPRARGAERSERVEETGRSEKDQRAAARETRKTAAEVEHQEVDAEKARNAAQDRVRAEAAGERPPVTEKEQRAAEREAKEERREDVQRAEANAAAREGAAAKGAAAPARAPAKGGRRK